MGAEHEEMTLAQKTFWLALLLCCVGFTLRLPRIAAPLIAPAPNTNTYGCHLVWDAVPGADSYTVWLGNSPDMLRIVTNVTGAEAIFRIPQTNSQPWVGVKAEAGNIESDMSDLLTKTNTLTGNVEAGDTVTGPWRVVPGTAFSIQTTNQAGFARMRGSLTDNWPRLP